MKRHSDVLTNANVEHLQMDLIFCSYDCLDRFDLVLELSPPNQAVIVDVEHKNEHKPDFRE